MSYQYQMIYHINIKQAFNDDPGVARNTYFPKVLIQSMYTMCGMVSVLRLAALSVKYLMSNSICSTV